MEEEEKSLKVSVYLDREFYERASEESVNRVKGTIRRSLAERNVELNHFYTTLQSGPALVDLHIENMPEDDDAEYVLTYPNPTTSWEHGDIWESLYYLDMPHLPLLLFLRLTPEQWLNWNEAEAQLRVVLEAMWTEGEYESAE